MRVMRSFAEWCGGSAEERALLAQCREAVWAVVPGADVILYGLRARGDARTDSDYDLLVLVEGEMDWIREDQLRQRLYPSRSMLIGMASCYDPRDPHSRPVSPRSGA